MNEFEIYLPSKQSDGQPIDAHLLDDIKAELKRMFGGYTCFAQKNEGAWQVGKVTFYDEVTLVRVIGNAEAVMTEFKKNLERELHQDSLLIIKRSVEIV